MKKGIVYGCLPDVEPQERFEIAARAGFHGVEIPGTLDATDTAYQHQLQDYKSAAEKAGIEIPSITASTHWSHPLSSNDANVRQFSADAISVDIKNAAKVGADTILVVPGVVNDETTYEDAWKNSLRVLRELSKIAADHDVTLALENVWNKFLLSPVEFKQYLQEVDSPFVKAYFDVGNIQLIGVPAHWILTLGDLLHRVHVKDFRKSDRQFLHLLHGEVNWPAVVKSLREVGYDNYVTAELAPYPQLPDQMAIDTSNALDRIFEM